MPPPPPSTAGSRPAGAASSTRVPGALPDVLAGDFVDTRASDAAIDGRAPRRSTPMSARGAPRSGCTTAGHASSGSSPHPMPPTAPPATASRSSDTEQPAARGLRLDHPQILRRAAGAGRSSRRSAAGAAPSARSSSKAPGLRRAERPAAARPRRRSRTAALGRHRERPAPRGHAAPASSARGHVQLAHRSGRRHRRRAARRADERRVCACGWDDRARSSSNARSPSSWARTWPTGRRRPTASSSTERVRTLEHPALGGSFVVTMTPLINEDGEPVGTVLVARDVTRQTRLEAEREALRAQARAVRKARLARPVRRRHRPRDQQSACRACSAISSC